MSTDKSPLYESHSAIIKATSIISSGTLTSRVLGFVRDILLARFLGTEARADAFFVAFRIPNLFRDMLGEGAANSTIVPVLAEYTDKNRKEELLKFVNIFFVLSLMTLSLVTLLGIIFAPLIVRVMAPGFIVDPPKVLLTVSLTRLMFPYLILIGLTTYFIAILYTFRSFVSAAYSPCLLNIALIASALVAPNFKEPVFVLAWGVLIGGLLQLLVQIRPLLRTGIRYQKPKTFMHPGAKKVGRLLIPRLYGSGVYQINIMVDTLCASLSAVVGAGGISAIYYATRIFQFPVGVFGAALASVVLSTLSILSTQNNKEEFRRTLVFSLKNIFLVMLPTSVFFILLSTPIIRVLFERGEFNAYSTQITSQALMFFSLGLIGIGGVKILVSAFHSLQDTMTPAKVATICLLINAVLNFALMWPLKIGGIALASSIAVTVNFLLLFKKMNKRIGSMGEELTRYLLKIAAAALVMALVIRVGWNHCSIMNEIGRLVLSGILGGIAYIGMCFLLKVDQMVSILKRFKIPK